MGVEIERVPTGGIELDENVLEVETDLAFFGLDPEVSVGAQIAKDEHSAVLLSLWDGVKVVRL